MKSQWFKYQYYHEYSFLLQGDSGGPLQEILKTETETTVYNVLGVVSYNFACASTKFPSVFTKIDHKDYMDWIEHIVWGNN